MKIKSEVFDAENSQLRIALEGEFSLAEAQAQFVDILDGVVKHQARTVLVDGRTLTGVPDSVQRYLYGEFVAKAVGAVSGRGLVKTPRFAYVLQDPVRDPGRLGQMVAKNRGMNVQTFDNMSDAEHWLAVTGPARIE